MSPMSLMRNQKGNAFVMILVLGAAVAAASVYLMDLSVTAEKSIKIISDREKYLRLNHVMREVFLSPTLCTAALSGKDINQAFDPDGLSLLPFTANIGGVNENIDGNWKSGEGLKLKDIKLFVSGADIRTGIKRDIAGSPSLNAINGEIWIQADRGTPSLNLPKYEDLRVPVMIYYEPTAGRSLYSCFGNAGEGALCTLMGGVYNSYSPIGTRPRCEPFAKCHLDGQGAQTVLNCTAPFQKVQISTGMFLCQWCNQNP